MQQLELEPKIPQTLSQNKSIPPVYFTVTEELIAQFSSLTGDTSHLHMSEDYARRSIYRQQIVHGMLPVAFVSLLRILHQKGIPACYDNSIASLSNRYSLEMNWLCKDN